MTQWMQQLLWHSLTMSAIVCAYYAATVGLHKRYAAKKFYLAGVILLVGFLIPLRPAVTVEMGKVPQFLQTAAMGAGSDLSTMPIDAQTAPGMARNLSWHIIFAIWALGALVTMLYHGIKHMRFISAVRHWRVDVQDPRLLAQLEVAKRSLGVESHDIGFAYCECIRVPMLLQLDRPTILLPQKGQDAYNLQFLLLHELIHYKRKDLLCRLLMLLSVAIHWFNPAIYLLVRLVTMQCEISCDETVVEGQDMEGRHQYAMSIIGAARCHSKSHTLLTTYFSGGIDTMKKRINSVYEPAKKRTGALLLVATLMLTLLAGTSIAADTAGGINYTLPEAPVKLNEKLDSYTISWEPMEGIKEYHIGTYYHLQLEEVTIKDPMTEEVWSGKDLWSVAEGWVGTGVVADNAGKEYQVENGAWESIKLPGDATEVEIGHQINKHLDPIELDPELNNGATEATKEALLDCVTVIVAVREDGEPIVTEINIPVA